MITRSEVLRVVGRNNLAAKIPCRRQAVDASVSRGFPAHWYPLLNSLWLEAAGGGEDLPYSLFNMLPADPAASSAAEDAAV